VTGDNFFDGFGFASVIYEDVGYTK